jgi:uncharacterized protein YrrD
MLIKVKTMAGYKLNSLDGDIGKVKEFYFDDHFWTVRYLVADTGTWLANKLVLISPYALTTVATVDETISVNLTQKQIEDSPAVYSDLPVSQQFEESYYSYYGWPTYWSGSGMWGNTPFIMRDHGEWDSSRISENQWDRHLRSTHGVDGYHIRATDGKIGHVTDFIIDDETWAIRYLIVDTRNWWPGKLVLISPQWIDSIDWAGSEIQVNISLETIQSSPEFNDESLLTRGYESALYEHYNHRGYWANDLPAKEMAAP